MDSGEVVRVSTLQTRFLLITLFMYMVWTVEHAAIFGLAEKIQPCFIKLKQADQSKLLWVIIQSDLKWDANTHYINKKAAKRLHDIRCLKKAGLPTDELLRIQLSLVHTVCEYACQVQATCLTEELCTVLESIQR